MSLDERLRSDLRRAADPGDPTGAFDEVVRRRGRRALARRVQRAGLAVVVVAGSVLGVVGLVRLFGGASTTPAAPVGESIVYQGQVGGSHDLYATDPGGGDPRRLTEDPATETDPAISPDGSLIAFTSDRTGSLQIHVMEIGGGPDTPLSTGPSESVEPAWSPDGTRIAFSSTRTGSGDIYVMDADGSDVVQLTGLGERPEQGTVGGDDTRQWEGSPAWSPDGTRIAFVGEIGDNPDIWIMDADGSGVVRLTDDPGGDWHPAWSPDGTWIAFQGSFEEPAGDIYLIRPDGSDLRRLTDDPGRDLQPAWSPDGTRIVFASDRDGELGLFVMDSDGSSQRRIVEGPGAAPAWGPAPPEETPTPTGMPTVTLSPEPSGEPTPSPAPSGDDGIPGWMLPAWSDPACEASARIADFGGSVEEDVAMIARAECLGTPEAPDAAWSIAVEWDASTTGVWALPECEDWCQAYAAPDLDGDGRHELAVSVLAFSIQDLVVYTIPPREPGPAALRVSPPGDPEGGFRPDEPARFPVGGDGFATYNTVCEDGPDGRVIVVRAAESLPHDSPDAVWHVRETVLRLVGASPLDAPDPSDGAFEVVSTRTYTVPVDDPAADDLFFVEGSFCGAPTRGP
ncbi:MAG: PD40 domain-containing protein [Actinobacteria bacterium]|nr:PD40 domain-containing protein [Actinomycetota bacterium]